MNPRIINLLCFIVGIPVGFGINILLGGVSLGLAGFLVGVSFCALVFGAPHKNPKAGYFGWGALGAALGMVSILIFLLMFLAG